MVVWWAQDRSPKGDGYRSDLREQYPRFQLHHHHQGSEIVILSLVALQDRNWFFLEHRGPYNDHEMVDDEGVGRTPSFPLERILLSSKLKDHWFLFHMLINLTRPSSTGFSQIDIIHSFSQILLLIIFLSSGNEGVLPRSLVFS